MNFSPPSILRILKPLASLHFTLFRGVDFSPPSAPCVLKKLASLYFTLLRGVDFSPPSILCVLKPLASLFNSLSAMLKNDGLFYCSFKYGEQEIERNGRLFTTLKQGVIRILS